MPPSPYIKYYPEFPDSTSIRRIPLKDSAVVELLRIESPSSLFVRPIDHIRNQLIYTEPYQLTPITDIHVGAYALAPIEERMFGRCQIVKNIERWEACRVFFIDEAITANISWKCLFKIDEKEMFHPWQAMHITLGRMISLTGSWSFEQNQAFADILYEFDKFQITPSEVDVEDSHDRPALLCNLYGIPKNQSINEKIAIEDICGVTIPDVLISIYPLSLISDPKLSDLDKEQDDLEVFILEEFRRGLPSDWLHESPELWVEGDEAWDIDTCKINEWSPQSLQKYLLEDHCFWSFIKPTSTVSPWEMYIIPILMEKTQRNDEQWIIDQIAEKKEQQRVFDDFYSLLKNQRPLEEEEIRQALSKGRAYAIASVQHRKKTGAQWFRCEILDFLPNNNLAIRFVDQGFKSFHKLKNIYRIHRTHTKQLPFVMEIGQFFDDDSLDEGLMEWSNRVWRDIIPYDMPVIIGPKLEFVETGKLLISEIRNIEDGDDSNLFKEIPPPPEFSEEDTILEENSDYEYYENGGFEEADSKEEQEENYDSTDSDRDLDDY